jgi:hypothetical protein
MDWIPYKNSHGEWVERYRLILTAWPTGAWSVHCPSGKIKPRTSDLLFCPVEGGVEAAKKMAEKAALEMAAPADGQRPVEN